MNDTLNDPMGLLLAAARVDPVLMQAARQIDVELQGYRAIERPVCPSCNGDEWMMEPEGDDPGCHCGGCTDGKVPLARLAFIGAEAIAALTQLADDYAARMHGVVALGNFQQAIARAVQP